MNCVTCDCFKAACPTQLSEPQQQLSVSFAGVILFYGARQGGNWAMKTADSGFCGEDKVYLKLWRIFMVENLDTADQ